MGKIKELSRKREVVPKGDEDTAVATGGAWAGETSSIQERALWLAEGRSVLNGLTWTRQGSAETEAKGAAGAVRVISMSAQPRVMWWQQDMGAR